MRCNILLKSLLVSLVLLIAVAALAAPPANNQSVTNSGSAIRTYLQPDLTFKSVLSSDLPIQAQEMQSVFGRTCRCSCGFPCKTNADCGPGGVCSAGITCCNKGPESPSEEWFQGATLSSRTAPLPAMKTNCK